MVHLHRRRASIKLDNFLPSRQSSSDLEKRNIMLSEGGTIDTIREKRCDTSLLDKEVAKRPIPKEIGLVVDLNQMESSSNKLNKASQEAMNQSRIQEEPYEYGYNDDDRQYNQYTRRRDSPEIDATSVTPTKAPNDRNNSANNNVNIKQVLLHDLMLKEVKCLSFCFCFVAAPVVSVQSTFDSCAEVSL